MAWDYFPTTYVGGALHMVSDSEVKRLCEDDIRSVAVG